MPSSNFMSISYFRTQLKRPLLDEIVTAFLCLCSNNFHSLNVFQIAAKVAKLVTLG